jgi:hypothetical protein
MALFKAGTKRYMIAELHAQGLTEREAYSELRPLVAGQVRPWVFTRNGPNGREAKSLSDQYVELTHEIARVYATIKRIGNNEVPAPAPKAPKEIPTPADDTPKPRAKGKSKDEEKRHFVSEWKRLRRWISETADRTGAIPLDSLDTMRPIQAARALIDCGISASTLLYAMTLHWPDASRDMAGVAKVDFHDESEDLGKEFHRLAGYVLKLANGVRNSPIDQRFGIMLIGPAGTGKSRLCRQIASLIKTEDHPNGLPYGETPMTPGATRGDLLGRLTANSEVPFITSQFVEIYSGGGVFNFEEIDAADSGMLIVLNNALASGRLYNSANGEVYEMHRDFIAVATANTFGLGSDVKYTGRDKLDLATIDRFRMARVLLSLDENLAEYLMFRER